MSLIRSGNEMSMFFTDSGETILITYSLSQESIVKFTFWTQLMEVWFTWFSFPIFLSVFFGSMWIFWGCCFSLHRIPSLTPGDESQIFRTDKGLTTFHHRPLEWEKHATYAPDPGSPGRHSAWFCHSYVIIIKGLVTKRQIVCVCVCAIMIK